jgi:hypothetical protein
MQNKVHPERRRGKRVPLTFEVEVSGLGLNGVPYCDLATASEVSDRGCKLRLSREVKPGDLLTIRVVREGSAGAQQESPFLYQVVWVDPGLDRWTAGLAALEPGNPWRMKFPLEQLVSE